MTTIAEGAAAVSAALGLANPPSLKELKNIPETS
jgi:hypothetical protein